MAASRPPFARVTALLQEQRYRRQCLDGDRKLAAVSLVAVTAAVGLVIRNDLILVQDPTALRLLLLGKLLSAIVLGVVLVLLRRAKRPRQVDRLVSIGIAASMFSAAHTVLSRCPSGEVLGSILSSFAILFVLYFTMRGPLAPRALGASIYMVATLILLLSPRTQISSAATAVAVLSVVVTNLGGFASALVFEQTRRARFAADRQLAVKVRELAIAKDRAEANARARAAFVAMMSHEFRTPMNAVIGLSDLVLEAPLSDELRERIRTINESARALHALLEEILDFAKIDAQKILLSAVPFNLPMLAASVVEMLRPASALSALALSLSVSPEVPEALLGDDAHLRQVLVNLVSNAIKFTERGGVTLRIAARPLGGGDHEIVFRVEDSGIGMTKDVIARLFRPFEQGDEGITRRHGGTGLGLAISKQIVMAMGGDLQVESVPRQGSVFSFTLRLAATIPVPAAAPPAPRQGGPPLAILVVDDNPINREVARAKLGRLGYAVDLANDGAEALLAASKKEYDIVFMDLQMPEMSGIAATERMLAGLGGHRAPYIVAMTASVFEADREACRAAGMRDFVGKPIDLAQLDAVLRRVAAERGIAAPLLSREALAKIERIQIPGEEDFFGRLCQLFTADAQRRLSRMIDGLGRKDAKAIAREAHAMRAASASLGATEVAELLGRIEEVASADRVEELGEWVHALPAKLQALERALAREVSAS